MGNMKDRIFAFIADHFILLGIFSLIAKKIVESNDLTTVIENSIWGSYVYLAVPKVLVSIILSISVVMFLGQTFSKKVLKLKVVKEDMKDLTPLEIIQREVVMKYSLWILTMGIWYIIDAIPAIFRKDRKTIHDLMMKTKVITEEEYIRYQEQNKKNKKFEKSRKERRAEKRKEEKNKNKKN